MILANRGIWINISIGVLAITIALYALLYYLERTREISGVWLYQFEGSNFFEGATPADVRENRQQDAGWLELPSGSPLLENLDHGYDSSGCWKVTAVELRFLGRKRFELSGHLSAWTSSYEIEDLLKAQTVPWPDCDSPYHWGD